MSPGLEPQLRGLLATDDVNAARLATADWLIGVLAGKTAVDHSAVTSAFLAFSPNLMPMLDSPEGVQAVTSAIASMLGAERAGIEPTSH
jgi:hypothetical protein